MRRAPTGFASRTRSSVSGSLRALGLAGLLVAALVALYALAVGTDSGAALDARGVVSLDPNLAPRVYEATESLLETVSVVSIALFGAAVAAIALLRRRAELALGALGLIAAANVTTQLMKPTLGRVDPTGGDIERVLAGAFPSGHTTVAASLAVALVLVTPAGLRLAVAALGGTYAAGVGIATVALGWHYPSDVAGGYLVVATWACLVVAALRARPSLRTSRPIAPVARRAALAVVAGAFLLVLVTGTGLAYARAPELLTAVQARTTFFALAAVLAVMACAVLGGFAAALDRGARSA